MACDFISHYYPNVLEAMRTRWISPQIISSNRIGDAAYDEVKAMGAAVAAALGIDTSATHMEWFFGPKGLRFSEIGCRPPGVGQWDSYCAGNEFDLYREWALAVCHQASDRPPSRRYSCGIIALRPDRDGVISGYDGTAQSSTPSAISWSVATSRRPARPRRRSPPATWPMPGCASAIPTMTNSGAS